MSPVTSDDPMIAVASMSPPTINALRARRRMALRVAIRRNTRLRTAPTATTPNAMAMIASRAMAKAPTGTPKTRSTGQLRSKAGTSATRTS